MSAPAAAPSGAGPSGTGRTRASAPPRPGSGRRRPPAVQRVLGRQPLGALFGAPYLVFVLAVFAVPLAFAVWMSVHDYFFAAPGADVDRPFTGLANFGAVLSDPAVQRAFLNIVVFLVINVPLTVVLGLLLAVALDAPLKGLSFFRAAYYVPYITSSVAVVGVWLFLFGGDGLVNRLLEPLGLVPDPSWLVNSTWAMPMIAVFVTWKQLGFYILLYLAALQAVPRELHESAATDGAGRVRRFWSVTVPGVRPATLLVVLLSTIVGANLFTEPYLLTGGGGPDGASATPVLLLYQRGIEQNEPGEAAAIGILLVVLVLVVSLVNRRLVGGER
nr:sugar ABC transporter permease [uncultured Pseudokineococcus sp.]